MTFDPTKPVQTRDGRKARIICTDRRGVSCPIIALVGSGDQLLCHYPNGRYLQHEESCNDLINVPDMKSFWVNVYHDTPNLFGDIVDTREEVQNRKRINETLSSILEIRMCDGKLVDCIQHEVKK